MSKVQTYLSFVTHQKRLEANRKAIRGGEGGWEGGLSRGSSEGKYNAPLVDLVEAHCLPRISASLLLPGLETLLGSLHSVKWE